jgi:teichuronic acid biosynthesis glycosyltransferase TuaC
MKVLVLTSLYPNDAQPRHGIFIEHRVAHVAAAGDEIRVVAPVPWFPFTHPVFGDYARFARAPRTAQRRGVAITHPRYPVIPKLPLLTPHTMAAAVRPHLARLRRDFAFDVIDSYYLYPDGVAATLLGAALDVPVVLTALGTDVSLIAQAPTERARILAATRRAAKVTAVCGALRDELVALGTAPDTVCVIEHGVDLDLFRPPADRAALRARLGMTAPTVMIVGHLIDLKGQDLAIRAVASLPGVHLLVVGHGPKEGALRTLAADLGVLDRVDFLGHVDQARLGELYGAVDIVANCSEREGIANVLLEALACGTPLVATPVWGSPEVVKVPEAGVLTRDRSVEVIAEGIASVLRDPPDRAATRAFAERYDWDETGRRHHAVLADAVARYGAGG